MWLWGGFDRENSTEDGFRSTHRIIWFDVSAFQKVRIRARALTVEMIEPVDEIKFQVANESG